jgi:hypothetical protein
VPPLPDATRSAAPGQSDVTEIRPPVGLQGAEQAEEESGEFSVDDDELIDDQQPG